MNTAKFYLGVDGGGTSTIAAVADERGKILGTGKAGPSLYKVVGLKGAIENIKKAIIAAEKKARVHPRPYQYAVFGLSGVDSLKDWQTMSGQMFRNFKSRVGDRFRVVNDVVIALAAGTHDRYGAAVIAGTGSNAYAVGPKGEAYAGGLGSILSDEGSGYWIGGQALRAAVKSFDGRGPKTSLEREIGRVLRVKHMRAAVDVVYQPGFTKTSIAALTTTCIRCAQRGDVVASRIIAEAGQELAQLVTAVVKRSGLKNRAFDLILAGSLFRAGELCLRPFRAAVRSIAAQARFVRLQTSPVTGAVNIAWQVGAP